MLDTPAQPREGALHKRITVAGHTFELRYGYYQERERGLCPPVVLFPDLAAQRVYSPEGYLLVTQVQDACEHYCATIAPPENWCGDCTYFSGEHPEIGICRCAQHKLPQIGGSIK